VVHHPVVRQVMKMQIELETDLEVIGEADNGLAGIGLAPQLEPDVVLVDLDLPEMDGIATAWKLHAITPQIPVILLSLTDNGATRAQAREAGAVDFVAKQANPTILLDAIRNAAKSQE
jgi:two-component system nitrate/nitrite response regulator NarL